MRVLHAIVVPNLLINDDAAKTASIPGILSGLAIAADGLGWHQPHVTQAAPAAIRGGRNIVQELLIISRIHPRSFGRGNAVFCYLLVVRAAVCGVDRVRAEAISRNVP